MNNRAELTLMVDSPEIAEARGRFFAGLRQGNWEFFPTGRPSKPNFEAQVQEGSIRVNGLTLSPPETPREFVKRILFHDNLSDFTEYYSYLENIYSPQLLQLLKEFINETLLRHDQSPYEGRFTGPYRDSIVNLAFSPQDKKLTLEIEYQGIYFSDIRSKKKAAIVGSITQTFISNLVDESFVFHSISFSNTSLKDLVLSNSKLNMQELAERALKEEIVSTQQLLNDYREAERKKMPGEITYFKLQEPTLFVQMERAWKALNPYPLLNTETDYNTTLVQNYLLKYTQTIIHQTLVYDYQIAPISLNTFLNNIQDYDLPTLDRGDLKVKLSDLQEKIYLLAVSRTKQLIEELRPNNLSLANNLEEFLKLIENVKEQPDTEQHHLSLLIDALLHANQIARSPTAESIGAFILKGQQYAEFPINPKQNIDVKKILGAGIITFGAVVAFILGVPLKRLNVTLVSRKATAWFEKASGLAAAGGITFFSPPPSAVINKLISAASLGIKKENQPSSSAPSVEEPTEDDLTDRRDRRDKGKSII